MRKFALATVSMLCVMMTAACNEPLDLDGENTCVGLNGLYTASEMRASGTGENSALTYNFLSGGGSFTINFGSGGFTSVFRASPTAALVTRSGEYVPQNGTLTLGNQTLFPGAAAGTQFFSCTAQGKNLTLVASNSSYDFPGEDTAVPARIDIVLTKP